MRFALTDENAPIVADICRRLDGIPLAIELAAARVKMLSPKQLRERLDERFRVLTGGSRDVLPRQQTLRALIDWSHDLLDERERMLFRRLGIFVNGFTLEGAVAVGSGEDLDELDVFDVLASLVDKSLVLAEPQGDARALPVARIDARLCVGEARRCGRARSHCGAPSALSARPLCNVVRSSASEPHELPISLRRCRPSWRTCALRSTARWRVRTSSTAASCSPTSTGVGKPSDSMRKAWPGARRISRRSRRSSRDCALGSQSRCRSCSANPAHKVRALELATRRSSMHGPAATPRCSGRRLHGTRPQRWCSNRFDDVERAFAKAEAIPGTSANLRLELLQARALLSAFVAISRRRRARGSSSAKRIARSETPAASRLRRATSRRSNTREVRRSERSRSSRELLPACGPVPIGTCSQTCFATSRAISPRWTIFPARSRRRARRLEIRAAREPDHAYVAIAIEHLALVFALRGDSCARGHARRLRRRRVCATRIPARVHRDDDARPSHRALARKASHPTNSHD